MLMDINVNKNLLYVKKYVIVSTAQNFNINFTLIAFYEISCMEFLTISNAICTRQAM